VFKKKNKNKIPEGTPWCRLDLAVSAELGQLQVSKKKRRKEKVRKQQKAPRNKLRKRGHLGRKAPSPEKKRGVSVDQEGCGQTSQQTSPDWFEGGENAQENVWSDQAFGHSAQNEHEA